ncbi:GNAT family N-acetyltransferase [Lentzea tibetensis]|uniref:GNAT family N-acetyltransferase n=1 Tax=Lentzea tibetensis TaxID=2591470 RepID=A0A563EI40_9PSEU|nr:GNAT family N-acetyltransferase [Lentzea tibetensis]TWP45986.1 GNAT family N-acetyltransferase [Lentzea tibetensis]
MRLTRAEARHADELTELVLSSKAYEGDYASILDGYRVTAGYVERNVVFLAERNGEVLGFYGLVVDSAELDIMFVANEAQGLGVGALLVEHMLDQARQRGISAVRVVSHPPAAGFYERMGARRIGVIPARPPEVRWERPELVFDV